MKEYSYCGNSCLFRDLSADALPLSASSRPEGAWVAENRVIRTISGTGHVAAHPLHSSREANLVERRALLRALMERPVAHVLPVTRLCECSFETPFLEGVPLRDFGLGPDAKQLTHPHNRRPSWAPEALQAFLKELASGLIALHGMGIAHGDPALMNALIADESGAREAIWLDLNTIRPAAEENRALDAAGFIDLCVWPALLEAHAYSPSLFSELADAAERAPDVLAALCEVLEGARTDYQSGDVRAAFTLALRTRRRLPRTDLFGEIHRTLRACMASAYFLDQTVSDQDVRFTHTVLEAEQTRRCLMEEEVTRLHYLRFHEELEAARQSAAELQDWSKQLQEAARYHEEQVAAAEARAADLAGELEEARNLNREAEQQLTESRDRRLEEAAGQQEEQATAGELLRSSRSGAMKRITARVRRLRGTVSGAAMLFAACFGQRRRNLLFWAKAYTNETSRRVLRQQYQQHYYMARYPDVSESGVPGLLHYICTGYLEGRDPSETFDLQYYLDRYPDVRDSGIHPLLHFALFGAREGRIPSRRTITRNSGLPSVPAERVWLDNEWPADLPLVSVVIPCFNYGVYVQEAIDSVLKQTFPNYEIIVVEGGSTDGITPERLKELQPRYPSARFFFRSERHLAGDNRNYGIRQARGRYICCLDADDLIRPTYLEVAVFLAERYGYDLVYPSVQCFGESQITWRLADAAFPEIAVENQVSTVALFRKAAWETVGGFRDWGTGSEYVFEDWDFWLRIVGHGFRVKTIGEPLMLYRVHDTSLTATCKTDSEYQKRAIAEANRDLFEAPLRPPRETAVANTWANLGPLPSPGGKSVLLALPFLTIGGAETLFFTLVQGLVERGYHVSVITTLVLPKTITKNNGLFDPLTTSVYHLPEVFPDPKSWPEFIYYLLRRYAVRTVVIAGCQFLYDMLPELDRQFPNVRVIDQLFNDTGHIANNRQYAGLIDLNVVPSQALANTLIDQYGENRERVKVIPHGVTANAPTYRDRAEAFAASGLPARSAGKFLVSFFGRLSEEKSPRTFVEIARRLSSHSDIDFCLTGEGPERAAVVALIARYKLGERIFAPGFVADVRPLIACSDVVVLPSRLDGMPLIVLESQMCGKPVVASAVGSLPEMITDGVTGYLCPVNDVKAFCARIEKLHESSELRRRMGEQARAAALARYDARKMVDAYIAACEPLPSGGTDLRESAGA
jgi:glycosyltransferase involved in cell wall biosynthesis/GT2 family glycosyltransferase